MSESEINLRCCDCAFENPDIAKHCGMCGSGLASVSHSKDDSDEDLTYEKSIIRGRLSHITDYARKVWQRELWRMVGLTILGGIPFSIIIMVTINVYRSRGLSGWLWYVIALLGLGFLFSGACRVCLDAVRGRSASLVRAIVAGFVNIIPAGYLVLVLTSAGIMTAGLVWLWVIPVEYLSSPDSIFSGGLSTIFIMVWLVTALVLLLLPVYLWLIFGSTLAMCRILDRKSSPWLAPLWAVRQINSNHWDMFWIGTGQLFAQIIGICICYVGQFGTIPLNGITFSSAYEWLRLHNQNPDEY